MSQGLFGVQYRVNMYVDVRDSAGAVCEDPIHLGFWPNEDLGRLFMKGVTSGAGGLALAYPAKPGYTKTGTYQLRLDRIDKGSDGKLLSTVRIAAIEFNGVTKPVEREYR
jgi:hypothetical protein